MTTLQTDIIHHVLNLLKNSAPANSGSVATLGRFNIASSLLSWRTHRQWPGDIVFRESIVTTNKSWPWNIHDSECSTVFIDNVSPLLLTLS